MDQYIDVVTSSMAGANGIEYCYRRLGIEGALPLVLLQHFRGNLDNWDPALIDALAQSREIIAFDNAGVGGSTGTVPSSVAEMAHGAIAFLTALGLPQVDVLGYSLGGFVAQEDSGHRSDGGVRMVVAARSSWFTAVIHNPFRGTSWRDVR